MNAELAFTKKWSKNYAVEKMRDAFKGILRSQISIPVPKLSRFQKIKETLKLMDEGF